MESGGQPVSRDDMASLRVALKSQYHAALAMLREVIEHCPDDLWFSAEHRNSYWQLAYHALFFAHVYLQPAQADFRPWKGHQSDVQHADGIAPEGEDSSGSLPLIPRPYTKDEVLEYWSICDAMVDDALDSLDLASPNSGFSRHPMPKLEHQIMNIRHIQHHTAQMADRLRSAADEGTRWIRERR